jgi:hypothetical protein
MEKNVITISNPNPYKSKVNGTPMVSYKVSGTGAKQYAQDQLAKGVDSKDDEGNPLIHFTAKAAVKYGAESVLTRTTTASGETIWFTDNSEEKQMQDLIAGADDATKAAYAQGELEKLRNFARTLASNRSSNIAKLLAKSPKTIDKM